MRHESMSDEEITEEVYKIAQNIFGKVASRNAAESWVCYIRKNGVGEILKEESKRNKEGFVFITAIYETFDPIGSSKLYKALK